MHNELMRKAPGTSTGWVLRLSAEGESEVCHAAVAISHLNFAYNEGQTVLHDLSLEIPQGAFFGIVGHTGSGKSTSLYCFLSVLNNESRRIVTIDLPGHGRSSAPEDPARYGLARFADDVMTVLDRLQLDRVALAGHRGEVGNQRGPDSRGDLVRRRTGREQGEGDRPMRSANSWLEMRPLRCKASSIKRS